MSYFASRECNDVHCNATSDGCDVIPLRLPSAWNPKMAYNLRMSGTWAICKEDTALQLLRRIWTFQHFVNIYEALHCSAHFLDFRMYICTYKYSNSVHISASHISTSNIIASVTRSQKWWIQTLPGKGTRRTSAWLIMNLMPAKMRLNVCMLRFLSALDSPRNPSMQEAAAPLAQNLR